MSIERAKALETEGITLARQGQPANAVGPLREAIGLAPGVAELRLNLGIVLMQAGRAGDAERAMRQALALAPGLTSIHKNLGMLHLMAGRHAEAVRTLGIAAEREERPADRAALLNNMGVALRSLDRMADAAQYFRRALEADPTLIDAWKNLAMTLVDLRRGDEALAIVRRGLGLAPAAAELLAQFGQACKERGMAEEAALAVERARRLDPHDLETLHQQLMLAHYQAGATAEALRTLHAEMERRHGRPLRAYWRPHGNDRAPDRPLRVGYVSGDLRRHPVGFFLAGMMRHHDPARVVPVIYSCHPHQDEVTAAIRAGEAEWRQVHRMPDAELAELIRADGIDILVDLAGHTAHNRLRVFARKPAPVQVTWAGYVGTTGLAAIDWLIADRFHVREGEEVFYPECIARMPHGYVCWQPPADAPPVAPLPALFRGQVTFGCFNNIAKVTPKTVALWAEILRRVPTARLLMRTQALGDEGTRRRYFALFAESGIGAERLTLAGALPRPELLAAYGEIDVGLDPFPYSGGVTTLEALWMGVPVITMPGRSFASRHSTSHLSNVGHAEWIADGPADYVAKAVALAGDPEALAAVRRRLRGSLAASPLLDHKGFARDLEDLFRTLWHRHVASAAGDAPDPLPLVPAVEAALREAMAGQGKLSPFVLEMDGMSGRQYRLFINNLLGAIADPRYLEVGSWAGSTFCAAIEGNSLRALAIDNWSQFGGPMDRFFANLARCCSPATRVSVLHQDFREVVYAALGRFNVYLFDGPHAERDQYDGLALALPCLDEEFVFIVDDWNWESVRRGTATAIRDLGLTTKIMFEIRTTSDESHGKPWGERSDWHNGYFIAVLRKRNDTAMNSEASWPIQAD